MMETNYFGRILNGQYTDDLKRRLTDCIERFQAFDECGSPAIPYIAAWHENEGTVWYEFAGKRFVDLMGCSYEDLHETFRKGVIDRREYKTVKKGILQNIIDKLELKTLRTGLRDKIGKKGIEEAVYKVVGKKKKTFWIKDQAVIETYSKDKINISLGCLTIVTKEMETEEQLKKTQEALRKSEEKFRNQAIHDGLTGLYNTRYLYKALDELILNSAESQAPISLIFMDVDDFKQVVDTYGHLNASQALQEFAGTIRSVIQEPSFGVAYAGDEFVVVLPGHTKDQAIDMAEKIRSEIGKTVYLVDAGINVNLCASFGVASYPDDATDLRELLSLADEAMFSVKEHGKNSVKGTDK